MTTTPPKTLTAFNLEEAAVVFKTFLAGLDYAEKTCSIAGAEVPPELSQVQDLCRQIVFETERGALADVRRIKDLNRELGGVLPGHFGVKLLF